MNYLVLKYIQCSPTAKESSKHCRMAQENTCSGDRNPLCRIQTYILFHHPLLSDNNIGGFRIPYIYSLSAGKYQLFFSLESLCRATNRVPQRMPFYCRAMHVLLLESKLRANRAYQYEQRDVHLPYRYPY